MSSQPNFNLQCFKNYSCPNDALFKACRVGQASISSTVCSDRYGTEGYPDYNESLKGACESGVGYKNPDRVDYP